MPASSKAMQALEPDLCHASPATAAAIGQPATWRGDVFGHIGRKVRGGDRSFSGTRRSAALLATASTKRQHISVNSKHRKTLAALYVLPTSTAVVFADIEALVRALGGTVSEREGSRVKIELNGQQWRCHRPHPAKKPNAIKL